jgi:FMN phosphatase YigB (HAD superfamily)
MIRQTVFVDMDGVLYDFQIAFNRERLCDPAQPFPQSDHRFLMRSKSHARFPSGRRRYARHSCHYGAV